MAISNIYTGRQAGGYVPQFSQTQSAMKDLSKSMIGAEKMKVAEAQKDAADFQELMKVDPVAVLGAKAQKAQAEAIEVFTEYGTQIYKQSNGRPTEMDKVGISVMKSKLEAEQKAIQASQDRLMSDLRQAAARPDYYDLDHATMAVNEQMRSENPKYAGGIL